MIAPLDIDGRLVDRRLLEPQAVARCRVARCEAVCCAHGVFVSLAQAEDIREHRRWIVPHLPRDRADPRLWFGGRRLIEHDHPDGGMAVRTAVVRDPSHPAGCACVFLRPDRKCALQVAGESAGEHPWRLKPFYCALHPITFRRHVVTLEPAVNAAYPLRYDCFRAAATPARPLYQLFRAEMALALGESRLARLDGIVAADLGPFVLRTPREGP